MPHHKLWTLFCFSLTSELKCWCPFFRSFKVSLPYSDSETHSAFLFTAAQHPIIIPPRSTLWSFTAPGTISDESQNCRSQSPNFSAADAADVWNPCLDLIVGAAGLLEKNSEYDSTNVSLHRNDRPSVHVQNVAYHILTVHYDFV